MRQETREAPVSPRAWLFVGALVVGFRMKKSCRAAAPGRAKALHGSQCRGRCSHYIIITHPRKHKSQSHTQGVALLAWAEWQAEQPDRGVRPFLQRIAARYRAIRRPKPKPETVREWIAQNKTWRSQFALWRYRLAGRLPHWLPNFVFKVLYL
jgi:hypothetical protein